MNIFKIDKNNISTIENIYNEFKSKAQLEYGFEFEGYSVKFKVPDPDTLTVTGINPL